MPYDINHCRFSGMVKLERLHIVARDIAAKRKQPLRLTTGVMTMTQAPYKPCQKPGCPNLIRGRDGYCDQHKEYGQEQKRQQRRHYDRNRKSFRERGYRTQWDKVRAMKVRRYSLCQDCQEEGKIVPVQIVHHIIPADERPDLFLSMDNLKSLCRSCHARTHARMNDGRY